MEIKLLAQGKNDPPGLGYLSTPILDKTDNESLVMAVIEGGMRSGEPSVIIASSDSEGTIYIQTSLDKLLTAAQSLATMAETKWSWKRPEGSFTIIPPDKDTRKDLLESIKKELLEWDI